MNQPPENQSEHEGPLAEFGALRQEIERRAIIQNQLIALQVTLSGAVFGFTLTNSNRITLLLVLPFSTYILLGRYASQHAGIGEVGTYIKESLSARVPGGLKWEAWIQGRKTPKLPAISIIEPLLLLFPGISFLALTWVASSVFYSAWKRPSFSTLGLMAMWGLGLIASIAMVRVVWQTRRRWWLQSWRER